MEPEHLPLPSPNYGWVARITLTLPPIVLYSRYSMYVYIHHNLLEHDPVNRTSHLGGDPFFTSKAMPCALAFSASTWTQGFPINVRSFNGSNNTIMQWDDMVHENGFCGAWIFNILYTLKILWQYGSFFDIWESWVQVYCTMPSKAKIKISRPL